MVVVLAVVMAVVMVTTTAVVILVMATVVILVMAAAMALLTVMHRMALRLPLRHLRLLPSKTTGLKAGKAKRGRLSRVSPVFFAYK
jgi:hypothetical protein